MPLIPFLSQGEFRTRAGPVIVRRAALAALAGLGLFIGRAPRAVAPVARPVVVAPAVSRARALAPIIGKSGGSDFFTARPRVVVLPTPARSVAPVIGRSGGADLFTSRPVLVASRVARSVLRPWIGQAVATETEDVPTHAVRPIVVGRPAPAPLRWTGLIGSAVATETDDVPTHGVRPIVVSTPRTRAILQPFIGRAGGVDRIVTRTARHAIIVSERSQPPVVRWMGLVGTAAAYDGMVLSPPHYPLIVVRSPSQYVTPWTGFIASAAAQDLQVHVTPVPPGGRRIEPDPKTYRPLTDREIEGLWPSPRHVAAVPSIAPARNPGTPPIDPALLAILLAFMEDEL